MYYVVLGVGGLPVEVCGVFTTGLWVGGCLGAVVIALMNAIWWTARRTCHACVHAGWLPILLVAVLHES